MDSQEMSSAEEGKKNNEAMQANESVETPIADSTYDNYEELEVTTDEEAAESLELKFETKEEVLEQLKKLAESEELASKHDLDILKIAYSKIQKAEAKSEYDAYIAAGGDPEGFMPTVDVKDENFRELLTILKQKRAEFLEEQERTKAENLQKKLDILDKLKTMISSPEEANQSYNEFKELQNEWKEITNIPAERATELWKTYQLYTEQFYDLLKLNHEFREYDFKKNLETKTRLCEAAEKLAEEEDVIAAFKQLQILHQEYKEAGPVAKELREEIWNRFKAASTVINKRHQQHFEEIKAKEEENLAKKTALCERVEAIQTEELKTFTDWDNMTKEIIAIQAEWKTIGFAPQKMNTKIFERFRAACDAFFSQKTAFFKSIKEVQVANLQKKQALCEKAEALKDSTDWKSTSDKLTQLQKEWKTIGAVPKKHSESLWKRFIGACDYFFEQKNKATSSVREEELSNLEKKRSIIEQLKAITAEETENFAEKVRELAQEWNSIGHVPFKEKDKIYTEYREIADKLFGAINETATKRRLNNFKNNLKAAAEKEGNSLIKERDRLMRAYENMRNDIKTYENNLGFLNSKSKKGNSLVDELNRKVDKLKNELAVLKEKIKTINEEINKA